MVRRDTDTDLIRSLSVVAVPLFAMVSGHDMLQKPRSVSNSLRKAGRLMAATYAAKKIPLLKKLF